MTTAEATQTITIERHGKKVDVPGRVVTPGLAITQPEEAHYTLTHIPSGLRVTGISYCGEHVERAANTLADIGVNWTVDNKTLLANETNKAKILDTLQAIGRCVSDCWPSWSVRCNTCDWEWVDDYEEGPLDAKAAKEMADRHECEPWVEITPPDSDKWYRPSQVKDDGTIIEATA